MGSLEKYTSDKMVRYELNHNLRSSPRPSRNKEINAELSHLNYSLTPESHGRNTRECMEYYKSLLDETYIYGRESSREITRCLQWSIQAPADLAPEQKQDFFEACYDYLNGIYGIDSCISACIHVDEVMQNAKGERISKEHLHYMAIPRVENPRYLTAPEKFRDGILKLRENGLCLENEETKNVADTIARFYENELSKNETISEIAKAAKCKYADARKIYNAVVRKESESYKYKLNSEAFTSMKQMHEWHPELQRFLDSKGIKCTVSFKSQGKERGVSYTVEEAKTVTRLTGLSVEEIKSIEIENQKLHEQVKTLTKELKHSMERKNDLVWGNHSGWDDDWKKSEEIVHEF